MLRGEPIWPAVDATITIRPQPASRMSRLASCESRNGASRFTAIVYRNAS